MQGFIFHLIDPFGYPDTIRYFNLAQFLSSPSIAHFGDYAHQHGIVFVPLFLPVWLLVGKNMLGLSYEVWGLILQFVSVQIILWFTYLIALIAVGKIAARIALLLLVTHFGFFMLSGFITSEYPFMALMMITAWFSICWDSWNVKKFILLSLLMALLVSIRSQGLVFSFLITGYLVFSKKTKLHQGLFLLATPIACSLFHLYFFHHLDARFQETLSSNDIVSQSMFFLGDRFADYDFSIHGIRAILAKETVVHFFLRQPSVYLTLLTRHLGEFFAFLNKGFVSYYFLAGALILSSIRAKIKAKPIFVIWIFGNLLFTIFLLAPSDSIVRYQSSSFPFAIILVASAVASGFPSRANLRKTQIYAMVMAGLVLGSYLSYHFLEHKDLYVRWKSGRYSENLTLKEGAIKSAELIEEKIGARQEPIATMSAYDYGTIYRSQHTPVYLSWGWNREEIRDYLKTRKINYLIALQDELGILDRTGIRYEVVAPLTKRKYPQNQEYLCRFNID